jgi:hypothetical protein
MSKINCDECTKQSCKQRIDGALCSLNDETRDLIQLYETRDPVLISRKYIEILDSEIGRYSKAKELERIGKKDIKTVVGKDGEIVDIEIERGIDSRVTNLAQSIIKSGKIINDIVNPPKIQGGGYFQQNNQYNFGPGAVKEIMDLPEEEKQNVIKFIDDKLDNAKRND